MLIARVNYPNVPQMGISGQERQEKNTREKHIPETALYYYALLCQ